MHIDPSELLVQTETAFMDSLKAKLSTSPDPFAEDLSAIIEEYEKRASSAHIEIVEEVVGHYYPKLLPMLKACLAVMAGLSLKGRQMCLCLLLSGPSGAGKTTVIQMFFAPSPPRGTVPPEDAPEPPIKAHTYRTDRFTPKSFVSHATNVKKNELSVIDMLPQMENRLVVTKDMAPIFTGGDEELYANIGMMISVLDGEGLVTNSGARGSRGYDRQIIFNWIGGTTPISAAVHHMMGSLGTRILFYETPNDPPTTEQLVERAKRSSGAVGSDECQEAVNGFVVDFFRRHPLNSVDPESIHVSDQIAKQLVQWATLVQYGRAAVKRKRGFDGNYESEEVTAIEVPYKIVDHFRDLAQGHALIHGRSSVTEADLGLISHIALSSIPSQLGTILRALQTQDLLETGDVQKLCSENPLRPITDTTAKRYMRELYLLGICDWEEGTFGRGHATQIWLAEPFKWIKPDAVAPLPPPEEAPPADGEFRHIPLSAIEPKYV